MKRSPYPDSYEAVVSLLRENPEWRPVVVAALEEAKTIKSGRFAGAWVLERARRLGVHWMPNFRKLVAYGILIKDGETTRGGRRAYYSMPDRKGVERALNDVAPTTDKPPYSAHKITELGVALKSTVKVPFFADLASCGSPSLADGHIDDYVEVDTRLARPGHQYFLVRTEGDSMNAAGIHSGDAVLVRVQNYADIGQKVVVCLADGVMIKELQRSGNLTVLMPRSTSSEYKPIVLSENPVIQGVVVATIPGFK